MLFEMFASVVIEFYDTHIIIREITEGHKSCGGQTIACVLIEKINKQTKQAKKKKPEKTQDINLPSQ